MRAVPEQPARTEVYVPGIARYFKATMLPRSDGRFEASMLLRPDLVDDGGALRLGAVTYLVDVTTGICSGLAVVDRGLWIVTTDLQVEIVEPIVVGPARVVARAVRAGATTVVCAFEVSDDGDGGRVVGGGTSTNRPFEFTGDLDQMRFPVDVPIPHDDGSLVTDEPMLTQMGARFAAPIGSGVLEVEITETLRNPWGILHGGMIGVMVDHAAGALAPGRRTNGTTIRYLAPGRVGPVRATPRRLAEAGDGALIEVEVRDVGQDDRLMAVATVALR